MQLTLQQVLKQLEASSLLPLLLLDLNGGEDLTEAGFEPVALEQADERLGWRLAFPDHGHVSGRFRVHHPRLRLGFRPRNGRPKPASPLRIHYHFFPRPLPPPRARAESRRASSVRA